ncbi:hypothetical protein BWQ96_09729 [Gracilariopsis chorda]|uniref:CHAT domain-containing protein n=1 Tax=Gracilariopsis chorda TaxID=448386 RepID=A0A2V3IEP0_9FLOR|nr:hypothetical protein BWQ96_09729 [Gracilariopsis chorda]|eukprot:PXF40555.1 hypothetical protein BWQ96_09729 [Gracilariopsis chorda]
MFSHLTLPPGKQLYLAGCDISQFYNRTLDEDYAALAGILATSYLSDGNYHMALERFDRFKASLLLGFLSDGLGIARRLSGDLDRFDSLRNRYRMLKHKLDLASGKLEFDLVLTELNDVKQKIDDIVAVVNKQNSITDALPVSSREMVEFLDRSKAIAIVLFFAPRKELMKVGDFSEFLHAFSVWNGQVRLHEAEMSYFDRIVGFDVGNLQQMGNFVSKILRAHHFENAPTRLVVVPHRHLHAIPFAALRIQIDESGGEGKYLGDVFTGGIWMVPSLSIAVRVDERGVASKPLKECEIVSATFPKVRLRPPHEEVMQKIGFGGRSHVHIADPCPPHSEVMSRRKLKTCDILHLTCHGTFAGGRDTAAAHLNPSEVVNATGLSFGTGDEALLNMADIWGMGLRNCTLATVVACSGAVVDVLSESDESLSIGTAFLVAGARNVVCTLWPVHELSAAAIMLKCYEKLCSAAVDGDVDVSNISAFLGEAQSWFRDLTDSEYFDVLDRFDPDYKVTGLDNRYIREWAPFVVIGPPPWYSQ